MKSFIRILGTAAGLTLLAGDAVAQDAFASPAQAKLTDASSQDGAVSPRPRIRIPRVSRPPRIEEFINSSSPPPEMAHITGFRQREPGDGTPASEETHAYLGYDSENLYVVFVCKDDTSAIRARLAKREDILNDDAVHISLDTFRDRRRSYLFAANPRGIQLDGISTEGQEDDRSFDTLWHSEGRLTADGYVVWMAIPFRSLRFPNETQQFWGVALGRLILRKNELSFWPYVTRRVQGYHQQFADLEGLENISPGRNVQLIPYGIFTSSRFLDTQATGGPEFRTDHEARVGLDAKVVLKDALTLDVALNPDFSQVESDEPQVTINRRFEVYFPEKRPFFIENAGIFYTPITLFFSRRIADPQFGVRATGKIGRWTLGAIGMDDRAAPQAAECDPLDDRRSAIGVLRVQREFASQSFLGVFYTDRQHPSCGNRVFSVDTRLKLSQNWVLIGQYMRSYTRDSSNRHFQGPAYWFDLQHIGRHFTYSGRYNDRSPDFRTHSGFVVRSDVRQVEQFLSYVWRREKGRLISFGPNVFGVVNYDRQKRLEDWFVDANFFFEFPGQTYVNFGRTEHYELFRNIGYRQHMNSATLSTEWLKWLSLSSTVVQGTSVNYFPAGTLPPFLATYTKSTLGLTWRPRPRLRFDQTYIYTRLGTRKGSTPAGFSPGDAIFNNHLWRSKLNFQFTRALSLRTILDYDATLPNEALTIFPRSKRLTGDLLFTYLLHPGTALYIGYSDRAENLEIDAVSLAPLRTLRRTRSLSNSTGRTFFIKFSYLFRF
jgi:hypothetical protein